MELIMENINKSEFVDYINAKKRVEGIKGFYSHLIYYIIINCIIIVIKTQNIDEGETLWHAFYVPFFWGIGLFFHAMKIFNLIPFLGKAWEEKKIQEILENKNKSIN
ncbi:2TM domain-containing protein [Flavobacterium sp.]|uniref:2TM domain-containing protein n=1 Tax=Flavobacterium sp. TaxID=239 RepID=UPI00374D6884